MSETEIQQVQRFSDQRQEALERMTTERDTAIRDRDAYGFRCDELNDELDKLRAELAASQSRECAMREAVEAFETLIGESEGVYGLHLNGDPAPWSEVLSGGRFERIPNLEESLSSPAPVGWVKLNWHRADECPIRGGFILIRRKDHIAYTHVPTAFNGNPGDVWIYADELKGGNP